jgi:hypothetical protein
MAMKIGLVGPTYDQTSLPFDAQRTINLFPVMDQMGKEVASLYGTPGLSLFSTAGSGPIRGDFKSANGRVFFVSGSGLYEINSSGAATLRGTILNSYGMVSMAEGLTQLALCDGVNLYSLTYSTNTFAKVSDADLPASVGYVSNIDGYFVVNENITGRFYISGNNDTTTWEALDYATAESEPDYLTAPVKAVGQLWLFGEKTTEIWTNTGASSFPFARIAGAIMQTGILAKHTAKEIDNTVIWVGKDEFGYGIVYRANGFSPKRISTATIEKRIQTCSAPSDLYAWAYQDEGHVFYIISGGGLETSLSYDLTTDQWHERALLNDNGDYETHLATCHVIAFNRHLIGSRQDGKIYEMRMDYYDDDGREIVRDRVYTHLVDEGKRVRYNALEIGLETGVGSAETNPLVSLQLSRDGARTWSSWFTGGFGKLGEYQKKVVFRRLGVAEQMTFRLRITDKVKVVITGSYLQ